MTTTAKKAKLALLKRQLHSAIQTSRHDHGVWMAYRAKGDHKRGHGAMVVWQRQVKKVNSIQTQIQSLEDQLGYTATTPSRAVAQAIGTWEGGRGSDGLFHPYWDQWGKVWTIGYGHIEGVGPNSKALTPAEAVTLLLHDLSTSYGPHVNSTAKAYGLHLNQKQFDALTSAVYNLGWGVIQTGSTLGNALHAHDLKGAANALLLYDHAGGVVLEGLKRRREWERQLFNGGSYTVNN